MDEELTKRATVCFVASETLLESKRHLNPNTFLSPHGVDVDHFGRAAMPGAVPLDIADVPRPIVGFFGLIEEYIDLELLDYLASQRPQWTFLMIGRVAARPQRIPNRPNLRFIGPRPYEALPEYGRQFSAAIIPYRMTDFTFHANPLKLREYLAMGVPVVATRTPQTERFAHTAAIVDTPEEWLAALDRAVVTKESTAQASARMAVVADCSWDARLQKVWAKVQESIGASAPSRGDMTLKAGLVGAGNISRFHVQALRRLPNVEITGVTDLNTHQAQRFAAEMGIKAYASLKDLKEAGAQVIHVLTPPATHAAVALEALALGCDVFVEKPLATSDEDCLRIERAAAEHNRKVCVGHSQLYDPFVRRAIDLVQKGVIGDVLTFDYFRSQNPKTYASAAISSDQQRGGYPFRDIGIHALYLAEAFVGPIAEMEGWPGVTGRGDCNLWIDEWRVVARCEKGTAHVHLSWNVRPQQHLIVVQGTRGIIRCDLFGMSVTVKKERGLPEHARTRAEHAFRGDQHRDAGARQRRPRADEEIVAVPRRAGAHRRVLRASRGWARRSRHAFGCAARRAVHRAAGRAR